MEAIMLFEFRRAIHGRRFLITIGLITIAFWIPIIQQLGQLSFRDMDWAIWFLNGQMYLDAFLAITIPFLCTLPYADSLVIDIKSGYHRLLLSRSSAFAYGKAKYIVTGLVGMMAVALPLLLFLVICFFCFPHCAVADYRLPMNLYADVFLKSEWGYCLIIIAHTAVFAFVYSIFGLAFSTICWNRFAALLGPTLFDFIFTILLDTVPHSIVNLNGLCPHYFCIFDQPLCTYSGLYIEIVVVWLLATVFYFCRWGQYLRDEIL